MAISIYDPASQTVRPLRNRDALEPLVAAITGGPEQLSVLRQALVHDLLRRQREGRGYREDSALEGSLATFARETLGDACERESFRYWLLTAHYRAPLAFSEACGRGDYPELSESERRVEHFYRTRQRLAELPAERVLPVQTAPADALSGIALALRDALDDDLGTPAALAAMEAFLAAVNAGCDAALRKRGRINASAIEAAEAGFTECTRMLGLGSERPDHFLQRVRNRRASQRQIDVAAIDRKVAARAKARAAQDFETADRLHAELRELQVTLLDGPQGTSWTLA